MFASNKSMDHRKPHDVGYRNTNQTSTTINISLTISIESQMGRNDDAPVSIYV